MPVTEPLVTGDDMPRAPAPVSVLIDLEPGMTIHQEPYLGELPFVTIESGRTVIIIGINAGEARELTEDHLILVDQLAETFCWLRDQIRRVAPRPRPVVKAHP